MPLVHEDSGVIRSNWNIYCEFWRLGSVLRCNRWLGGSCVRGLMWGHVFAHWGDWDDVDGACLDQVCNSPLHL